MNREEVYALIDAERAKQDAVYAAEGPHGPSDWLVILMEELGEVAWSVLNNKAMDYEHELVQVAAVAVAALEEATDSWAMDDD